MSLYIIALVIFLIGYAINHFVKEPTLATLVAIAAGIAGVLLLIGEV